MTEPTPPSVSVPATAPVAAAGALSSELHALESLGGIAATAANGELSTKVTATAGTAAVVSPLVALAAYGLGKAHLDTSVVTPLVALAGTVLTGGLAFVAGYLRKELAKLH